MKFRNILSFFLCLTILFTVGQSVWVSASTDYYEDYFFVSTPEDYQINDDWMDVDYDQYGEFSIDDDKKDGLNLDVTGLADIFNMIILIIFMILF